MDADLFAILASLRHGTARHTLAVVPFSVAYSNCAGFSIPGPNGERNTSAFPGRVPGTSPANPRTRASASHQRSPPLTPAPAPSGPLGTRVHIPASSSRSGSREGVTMRPAAGPLRASLCRPGPKPGDRLTPAPAPARSRRRISTPEGVPQPARRLETPDSVQDRPPTAEGVSANLTRARSFRALWNEPLLYYLSPLSHGRLGSP